MSQSTRKPKIYSVYRQERGVCAIEVDRVEAFGPANAIARFLQDNPEADRHQHYAMAIPRVSEQMAHVLNLAGRQRVNISYVPLVDGKGSQSRTVGRGATIDACRRYGWLDARGALTQSGRLIRDAYNERHAHA